MEARKRRIVRKTETEYTIEGQVKLQTTTREPKDIQLEVSAIVGRQTIGKASVGKDGKFKISFQRKGPLTTPLQIVTGPTQKMGASTRVKTKKVQISPDQWKENKIFSDINVEEIYWLCWNTRDIIIHGIVCKEMPIPGSTLTKCCPVPFAEVEVFDVDSNLYISKIASLKTATVQIPKLKEYRIGKKLWPNPPTPENPTLKPMNFIMPPEANSEPVAEAEIASLPINVKAENIQIGSIGSIVPFYSKQSLGKTVTDDCGEFEITIKWPDCPTLYTDDSPDLIFKVTQTVGPPGSETTNTLVSEGYYQTRWNVPDFVYVQLDAADGVFVACNPDCAPFAEKRVYFMGIGEQVIEDHIAQPGDALGRATGYVYNGPFCKSPFGAQLKVRAKFGTKIEETGDRYYKISYAPVDPDNIQEPADTDWQPIAEVLTDTCFYSELVSGVGLVINHKQEALGPLSLSGSETVYYKIRNQQDDDGHDLGWVDENKIAVWDTTKVPDGLYVLKIEVVLEDGSPDPVVHYGDDLGNYARMYISVNNKEPVVDIKQILNADLPIDEDCGSFAHNIGDEVKFIVDAYHEDDHLLYWIMRYQIGYGSVAGKIAEDKTGETQEDFHGKENETVSWTAFDADFGWVPGGLNPTPTHDCDVYGVSVELEVRDKVTNGEVFLHTVITHLGTYQYHYKEVHAGLAVFHPTS